MLVGIGFLSVAIVVQQLAAPLLGNLLQLQIALLLALAAYLLPVTLQTSERAGASRARRLPIAWLRITVLLIALGFALAAFARGGLDWKPRLILFMLVLFYGPVFAQIAAHRHLAPMEWLRRLSFFGCGVLAGLIGYVMAQAEPVLSVTAEPLPWHPADWRLPAFTHTAVVALLYAIECAFRLGRVERIARDTPNGPHRRAGAKVDAFFFTVWLIAFTLDLAQARGASGRGLGIEGAILVALIYAAMLALSIGAAAVPIHLYWRRKKIAARFPVPVVAAEQGSLEQQLEELSDDYHEGRVDEATYRKGHADLVARLGHHGADES